MPKNPDPSDIYAGRMLKRRRIELGLSQTAIAEELGVTFQQVQKYEKGRNRISSSRLLQISHFLRVPVSYFFIEHNNPIPDPGGERATTSLEDVSQFLASHDGQKLARAYGKIKNETVRKSICGLVESLAVTHSTT